MHLLDGLGNYVIHPGVTKQVMVVDNNITTFGYTYVKISLKIPPDIVYTLTHIRWLSTWTYSSLAWAMAHQGIPRSLNRLSLSKAFTGTKNQEVPTNFETSTQFTLWDSGCTHSINTYFELYTEYKHLYLGGDTEFNGIWGDHKIPGDSHHYPGPGRRYRQNSKSHI